MKINLPKSNIHYHLLQQECIPVGCVPSAAAAVCWVPGRVVYLVRGVVYLVLGGVPGPGGGVPGPGGGCTWSRGCTGPGGVPGPRGVYLVLGGVYLVGGCTWSGGCTWFGGCTWSHRVHLVLGGVPGPTGGTCPGTPPCEQTHTCKNITFAWGLGVGQTPSPINRMTDRCKIITLPQTSFAGNNNLSFP